MDSQNHSWQHQHHHQSSHQTRDPSLAVCNHVEEDQNDIISLREGVVETRLIHCDRGDARSQDEIRQRHHEAIPDRIVGRHDLRQVLGGE